MFSQLAMIKKSKL